MKRAKRAMKFSKTQCFEKLAANLNPLAKKMIWMQITQSNKKRKGRRFTDEEKMISLAIMKQSPKGYRFLQQIFILPSRNTLNKLTSTLNVQPGINVQIFDAIKDQVKNWTENKKYCSIIFDEVKLEPGLDYQKGMDHINGFVHLNKKTNNFADHALAFMVRGAIHKWQQPVAYYFCEGATKNEELRVILKTLIGAVIDTGLIPVAVISDQGQSFQSALKGLMEETRSDQIKAGNPTDDVITLKGHDINVIYDPPHLIKGIRNNFLTKNMKFEGSVCKWSDIVDVYQTDCEHAESRLLHKLNDTHVIPDKINKMKVKTCTRVLSNTMAAALSYTSKFSHYSDGRKVSDTIKNTSKAVSFFDELFDSCNGATLNDKEAGGKSLKKAVTDGSQHHEFWRQAIKKLETIRFIDERRGEVSVPSVKNWIITLKSYIRLWQFFKNKNIKIMRPRYFNSDPIENFFGQVRAYNYRNNDPTCHSFINTFKSLLITRFIKFHSAGFNCEEDSGSQLLNIKKMFEPKECKEAEISNPLDNTTIDCDLEGMQAQVHRERLNVHSRAYTAGWVVRKILQKIKCKNCFTDLTAPQEGSCHGWISEREYNSIKNKRLSYPSEYVVRMFGDIVKETNEYLEKKPHINNISEKIKGHILSKYSFDFLKCATHKEVVLDMSLTVSVKFSIFNWCNIINKILKGTDICRLRKSLPLTQKKALIKF
ncbi:uncharacterized protein LOC134650837 [Cydia amplana]|uniref:uncharacterized protein LOC134650836 n=1 Tax=Cydia amplana TaxID=1869771 RepID=UPI002FE67964